MKVTDHLTSALRAHLRGDAEEHRRLFSQANGESDSLMWAALVGAGFFEAVDRRWTQNSDPASIIDYVAHVRAISPEISESVDPDLAEQMILACLGKAEVPEGSGEKRLAVQILIMTSLVHDEGLDGPELDEFLAEVRQTADRWLD
jgi:hypothetical protein